MTAILFYKKEIVFLIFSNSQDTICPVRDKIFAEKNVITNLSPVRDEIEKTKINYHKQKELHNG